MPPTAGSTCCAPTSPSSTTPPRRRAPSAATCPTCAATRRSPTWRRCASARSPDPRRPRRRLHRLRCWSSTSTSTTRRCCRRSSSPSRACTRPSARGPPARRPTGGVDRSRRRRSEIGFDGDGFAYDNERPAPRGRAARRSAIDRAPVTNGSLPRRSSRTAATGAASCGRRTGWQHPRARGLGAAALLDRRRRASAASTASSRSSRELPVMHVSWFEADAYARWAARGCPPRPSGSTPPARSSPERGHLDQLGFGPGPAGPFVGDCWEWTASEFGGYPGFEAFPYREYSEVFFGAGYRVLRGGSWATRPRVARNTLPQLGPPRAAPDLRRLPLRGGRVSATATCDRPAARCSTRSPTTCATA